MGNIQKRNLAWEGPEAFELRDGQWLLMATIAEKGPVSLPPFDAINFPLEALWPETATEKTAAGDEDAGSEDAE